MPFKTAHMAGPLANLSQPKHKSRGWSEAENNASNCLCSREDENHTAVQLHARKKCNSSSDHNPTNLLDLSLNFY